MTSVFFAIGMFMMACTITGCCCCCVGAQNEPDCVHCVES